MVEVHLFNLSHSSSPSIFNTLEAFGASDSLVALKTDFVTTDKIKKSSFLAGFYILRLCFDFIRMKVCFFFFLCLFFGGGGGAILQ